MLVLMCLPIRRINHTSVYCKYVLSNHVSLPVVLPIHFMHPTGKKKFTEQIHAGSMIFSIMIFPAYVILHVSW